MFFGVEFLPFSAVKHNTVLTYFECKGYSMLLTQVM